MTARETPFTEAKYREKLKEGRGRGEGADYLPWLTREELLSEGTRHLAHCGRTGRDVHLFSGTEHRGFLFYDSRPWVTNVYEQYPLERDETLDIARGLGIEHPIDRETRVHTVMQTDLVVDGIDGLGRTFRLARSCKLTTAFSKFNHIEHAEIERRYWQRRGVNWKFLVDGALGVSDGMYQNLDLMRPNRFLHREKHPYEGAFDEVCALVEEAVLDARKSEPLIGLAKALERRIYGDYSAAQLMLFLIYRGRLVASIADGPFLQQDAMTVAAATRNSAPLTRRFA